MTALDRLKMDRTRSDRPRDFVEQAVRRIKERKKENERVQVRYRDKRVRERALAFCLSSDDDHYLFN